VKPAVGRYPRSQAGYTLVELIVASAIGLVVMTGLTSVVLTSWRANTIATSRIEASSQIRNFEFVSYDDFALSGLPSISGCGTVPTPPCTIGLSGWQVSNSITPVPLDYQVTYIWDGTKVLRQVGVGADNAKLVATNVTAFSAYIDGTAPHQTVVVTMTVTMDATSEQPYVETQALRFYPRINP
jgi:prepilin-type N-terminal cleavage/methylation domain-containing protein